MVIHSRGNAPKWKDPRTGREARCRNIALPSREKGITEDPFFEDAKEAIQVCNGVDEEQGPCPYRSECLMWALMNNDTYGVFGGMTVPQRKWIRRNVPKNKRHSEEYLRKRTPPPEKFKDWGDDVEE